MLIQVDYGKKLLILHFLYSAFTVGLIFQTIPVIQSNLLNNNKQRNSAYLLGIS